MAVEKRGDLVRIELCMMVERARSSCCWSSLVLQTVRDRPKARTELEAGLVLQTGYWLTSVAYVVACANVWSSGCLCLTGPIVPINITVFIDNTIEFVGLFAIQLVATPNCKSLAALIASHSQPHGRQYVQQQQQQDGIAPIHLL